MRRAIELRQEELDDLEDTKCRRKSYALAQRESLPIPLPLPVYPPPKPIARPPPPKTIFRPVGQRANRGYRPSASANLLPSTPEVPSTPPVSNQHRGVPTLSPTPEEPPISASNSHSSIPNDVLNDVHRQPQITNTPEPSPKINGFPARRPQEPPPPPPRKTDLPPTEIVNDTISISSQKFPSSLESLPPSPHTHHLPPTPTSLSRSDTPNSLSCPRTPTSIRPAPWQLSNPTTLTHRVPSSPTVAAITRSSEGYPPTPPSSPSHQGLSDITPSSSLSSSLDQGLGHSTLSLVSSNQHLADQPTYIEGEEEVDEGLPGFSSSLSLNQIGGGASYPATLDVMHLNVDMRKDIPMTLESNGPPKGSQLDNNGLVPDPLTGDPVTDLVKRSGHGTVHGTSNGTGHDTTDNNSLVANNFHLVDFSKDHGNQEVTYKTYRRRFWILALFSAAAFLQSTVWGTFGAIAESALIAFPSWTDATIAAFPNWGPVIVVVFTVPMMWVTQKLGLRLGMIVCSVLVATATLLRCVTSQEQPFTILCHVGSILNAFGACLTLSLPAMVAATWFPPHERTTATAVGALWCQLGGAAIYMGPLIVRAPSSGDYTDKTNYIVKSETNPEDIKSDIMTLMYIHFGAAMLLLIAVLAYFPALPPSPPSASSAQEKTDFLAGIKSTVKNPQLLLVIIVYSFSFGVPVVWIGVLSLSLLEIDIHQDEAMGVAVTAVVCSGIAAFITARITDKVYGHLKITIIGLLIASSLFFLWFVFLTTGVIKPTLAQAYISVTGGVSFEYATVPLLVEMAVELGYPIPEGVIGAILTLLFNIVALVFLGLFQIHGIGYIWVSYVLLACVSLTTIPLLFVKETHNRFETDLKENKTEEPPTITST